MDREREADYSAYSVHREGLQSWRGMEDDGKGERGKSSVVERCVESRVGWRGRWERSVQLGKN